MGAHPGRVVFVATLLAVTLTAGVSSAVSDCVYSGVNFSDGAVSCQSGNQFRCSDGDWQSLDIPCQNPPPAPTVVNPAECACNENDMRNCQLQGLICCVSLEAGQCLRKCCPR